MARLRVKEIAEAQNIDATELFKRSNVAYNVILRIFNNPEYNATLQTLEALAAALGVKVRDLIDEEAPNSDIPESIIDNGK